MFLLWVCSQMSKRLFPNQNNQVSGENSHRVPGLGGRLLLHVLAGLRVPDDFPAGGRVARGGGAAARPRQKAKAVADRVRETGLRSDLQSGIRA